MKFIISHSRAFIGQNISVEVDADTGETIRHVTVNLDGFDIDSVDLPPGTTQYKRDFNNVGDAGPGMDHVLIVTATDQDLNNHSSETRWTDSN